MVWQMVISAKRVGAVPLKRLVLKALTEMTFEQRPEGSE